MIIGDYLREARESNRTPRQHLRRLLYGRRHTGVIVPCAPQGYPRQRTQPGTRAQVIVVHHKVPDGDTRDIVLHAGQGDYYLNRRDARVLAWRLVKCVLGSRAGL